MSEPVHAQGCVSARHLPSAMPFDYEALMQFELDSSSEEGILETQTLGEEASVSRPGEHATTTQIEVPRSADDLSILDRGDFEFAVSFRALKAEDVFVGNQEIHAAKAANANPIGEFATLDLNVTYGLNRRWSLSLNLPLVSNVGNFPMPDGQRHKVRTGLQPGDVRITANRWLFDPAKRRSGNAVFGFGVKVPTGTDGVDDQFFTAEGPIMIPIDGALQPGDGGWGFTLQAQVFSIIARRTYYYGDAAYVINPRETTGVITPASSGQSLSLSVPDQYSARSGLGYLLAPRRGISASLGLRIDGIPDRDLIGGDGGFRRPGYSLAVEPGVNLRWGPHLFSVQIPLAIERSRQQSVPESQLGIHLGGSMADEQVILSYSRRF